MKADTLKKSILQYAMQGKLVPQDQNDEPASELLKRIKAEKEQLIKDGKIKKEKPLPPITQDEIPYDLPQGWQWVRLGNISLVNGGYAFKSSEYKNTGIRVVRISDFNELGFVNNNIVRYDYNSKLEDYLLEEKNIILCMTGGTVGKSLFIKKLAEPMVTNQRVGTIKILSVIEDYINYSILSPLTQQVITESKNSTNDNISIETIKNFLIPLPPLAEQKRIVEKLEEILPLVAEYGKNEEILSEMNQKLPKQIRQSILQYAVQGKLVEQNPQDEPASELLKRIYQEKDNLIKNKKLKKDKKDYQIIKDNNGNHYEKIGNLSKNITEQIPYSIPYNWQWTKIRNIAFVTKLAGFEYTKYMKLADQGEVPVIRAQNVKAAKLDLTNLKYINYDTSIFLERSSLNKECLLMTFIGAGIGDVALFNINKRFHLAPNVAKIEIYNNYENIDNKYIMYYLLSKTGKQEIFKFLKATAQPSLSMDTIREIYVPIPPLAEQKRIVAKVDKLMQLCEELEIENNIARKSSSELFQSIMQNYFTQKESPNKIIDLNFKRAVLSAKIINELYEEKYFGAVKLEKILYLCETHLGITLNGKYKKEAAGPYDAKSRYEVEDILKIKKWFDVQKVTNGSVEITKYLPLENCHEIKTLYNDVFAGSLSKIDKLMDLFKGKNSDFCESIATLYAVWKNRLNNNLTCSNSELIADFKMWSKSKERFYDSDLLDRILFMRRKGLTPDSNIKK